MLEAILELERINGISASRKMKDQTAMSDGFGEIGFTEKDREALIKATYVLGEVEKKLDKYEARFERIERERVSKEESDKIAKTLADKLNETALNSARETDRIASSLAEKVREITVAQAKAETKHATELAAVSTRLAVMEKQVWKWIAWAGGAFTAIGVTLKLFKIL